MQQHNPATALADMSLDELQAELERLRAKAPPNYAQTSARLVHEIQRRNGGSKNPKYGVG